MMDKKPSKCRFRVMKFEENAISSSKNEMRTESVKPAKGPRGSRGSRAPERTRSPDPQASIKDTTTKQDRKSTRTVGKKPVKKIILNQRSNTITGELKRIFSSTNYPELNSARDAHQVGDKAKKTKKKAKGKRKKSYLPDHFRRYEDTVTYKCETNKSPLRTRNEPLRYEQKRITPSMYYLSAGDSIEREISKAPREPKATDESCDCLPAEITCPNASHYKDNLSSRNSRKCNEDCMIWRAGEGKNLPICHCASLNINLNRHTARRYCICSTNKSGMPIHPTTTTHSNVQTSTHADGQTSRFLHNNASSKCQTLHKNSTSRMFEKSAQPSKILPKMCSITNTADIGCNSRALANSSSKNVTIKSLWSNMNSRSSHQLINYNCSALKCNLVRSNPSCQCRMNATCKCPSSNWTFKGRNSSTAGKEAQCLVIPTDGSVTETPKRHVSVHPDCPAVCSVSQNTKNSASTMPSFGSNLKTAYRKARTAITGTGDAPPTNPACVSVQTGSSPASTKLGHSVSCPVDDGSDCRLLLRSLSEMPKYISRDKPYSKIPKTTRFKHDTGSLRPPCNRSCGSFPVIRTLDCRCSPIPVLVNDVRMRKKPSRHSFFKIKKLFFFFKFGKDVEPDICSPPKTLYSVAAATSVPIISGDVEAGCLNDSCRAGPRRVYGLFQPIFTRSTCYFYYIIYVIAMIVCSPFVAIIYFCRFVTSPIRPSGYDCGEICPTCIPPRPCPHALISIFKSRQWFDKATVCSNAEPTTRRVGKRQKTSSSSTLIQVVDSKLKTKHQGVINQNSTTRQAQECNKRIKKRQFQTYYSEIPSKCPEIFSKPRPRKDHRISRCSNCPKPPPCAKISSKTPPCEDKSSKPPPCEHKKKRSICWKPRSSKDQIPPSNRFQPPSNRNHGTPRQSPARPCIIKRKPCKTKVCKNRRCKWKNVFAAVKCHFRKTRIKVIEFWEKNQPTEPTPETCKELTGPYDMLPPPPLYLYDSYMWRKSFFRARPTPKDSWYYYCTYIIAATFWCPLGLCLYFTYKAFGKCYG